MAPAAVSPQSPVVNLQSPAVGSRSSVAGVQQAEPGRAHLEALLRAKKLDRTLTTALPAGPVEDTVAPFGIAALDTKLLGGVPRGHLSEIVGEVSSGKTSLAWAWLAGATRRGETAALVDTFDRFDPAAAAACGIELSRLLWVRGQAISKTAGAVDPAWLPGARTVEGPGTMLERTIDRALKALNLVLQSGVCTAVILDMADVPLAGLRRIPMTTWLRVQRVIEGSDTVCVLLAPVPLARSAAGVTITTGTADGSGVRWAGAHDRSRRMAGVEIRSRLSSSRRTPTGAVAISTSTHAHRHIATSLYHQIPTSPDHQIPTSPDRQISRSPDHQVSISTDHQISTSLDHQIPTSPNPISPNPISPNPISPNLQISKSPNEVGV